ncbi:MAG: DUF4355 domain-containing protein [Steroidobacteraceae bacterium]|nr:DUF4355 domain-containing protein [Steroidobacteraceae bacterium]
MQDAGTEMQAPQDAAAEDLEAQQALAEAMQQSPEDAQQAEEQEPQADPWADPETAKREITKLRREAAKWRRQYREAEPQLAEYRKWQDSQKTKEQKLAEELERAQRERDEAVLGHARMMAAATYSLPPDLINRIAGSTPEEINEAAEEIAELIEQIVSDRLAASARPVSTRPVESLTPGAAPASAEPLDMNTLLRRRAGF